MYTLFAHQQKAVELAKSRNVALFHDCGCGKSCTALNIIKYKKSVGFAPALVICPLSIIESAWLSDCQRFTPELSIVSLHHDKPSVRRKRLEERHDIYVANFETFKGLFPEIQAKKFGVLIVDESSKMKDYNSQTTRALLAMAGLPTRNKAGVVFKTDWIVPNRYVLSGTPAPNSEDEYFAQIKFITGPGNKVFHDNFYAFRNRYFFAIPVGNNQKIFKFKKTIDRQAPDGSFQQVNAREEFSSRIAQVAHVVRKEDAVDLPEQVHEIRHVELGKEERKAYDAMNEDLVIRFAEDTVLATTALTEVMKLRQLTSGFCYGLEGTHVTGRSKLTELSELLEEIGDKQVVIWANFQHEIAEILKLLPTAGAIWGQSDDREGAITDFQTGKTRYLVANPASAAHGLTFVNCSYAVYFSMNYSYELQKQSEDRIHRIGQTKKCTYYHLVAKNTIDEVICKAVKSKRDMNTEILTYLRSQHGSYKKATVQV